MWPSGRSGHADLPQSRALRQTKGNPAVKFLCASGRPLQAGHRAQKDHTAKRSINTARRQVLQNTSKQLAKHKHKQTLVKRNEAARSGNWLIQQLAQETHGRQKTNGTEANLLQQKWTVHSKIRALPKTSWQQRQKTQIAANSPDTFYMSSNPELHLPMRARSTGPTSLVHRAAGLETQMFLVRQHRQHPYFDHAFAHSLTTTHVVRHDFACSLTLRKMDFGTSLFRQVYNSNFHQFRQTRDYWFHYRVINRILTRKCRQMAETFNGCRVPRLVTVNRKSVG